MALIAIINDFVLPVIYGKKSCGIALRLM